MTNQDIQNFTEDTMSKYFRFLNQNRSYATPHGLRDSVTQVLIILILTCTLVGISPSSVLAVGTTYYVDNTEPGVL